MSASLTWGPGLQRIIRLLDTFTEEVADLD